MKKLSLILALIFVFSCSVLAACGGEEESSAPAESSKSAVSSQAPVSSEAEEESSEPEEESSEPEVTVVPVTGEKLEGLTYTTSALMRMGGADVDWNWDENAVISYPDEGNDMTDGILPEAGTDNYDPAWIGFHNTVPDYVENGYCSITVDLGEVKAITGAKAYTATAGLGVNGIEAPSSVEVLVSEDGENYTSIGTVVPTNSADNLYEVVEVGCEATNAQYVQYRFVISVYWAFVAEVEVYAPAAE